MQVAVVRLRYNGHKLPNLPPKPYAGSKVPTIELDLQASSLQLLRDEVDIAVLVVSPGVVIQMVAIRALRRVADAARL